MSHRWRTRLLSLLVSTLLGLPVPSLLPAQEARRQGERIDGANYARDKGKFTLTVQNQGYEHLRVYVIRDGVPFRLGTAPSLRTTHLRANCRDFTNRKSDFLLRPIPGPAHRVRGEVLTGCDQRIRIQILPIGLQHTRVWLE
ncbi:MAG: hypothetical protein ACE5HP_12410 [Gemmatimonadota bacterium]